MSRIAAALMGLTLLVAVPSAGCESNPKLDARVETFAPDLEAERGPELVAWLEAMAKVHATADRALAQGRTEAAIEALERGLDVSAPGAGDASFSGGDVAAIVRLDLAARYGELGASSADGASATVERLEPMLRPERPLPLDRASARALVALGDAASVVEDHALAAGSYARALRIMSELRRASARRVLGAEAQP